MRLRGRPSTSFVAAKTFRYESSRDTCILGLLPTFSESIQQLADKNYELLKDDPDHLSLHFKKVGPFRSVSVGIAFRALGIEEGGSVIWFWIGNHDEYERLLGR